MVGQQRKVLKLHWMQRFETVPPQKNILPKNDSKSHICSLLISDIQIECLKANKN